MSAITTQYRYISGYGLTYGETVNTGYNIGITPIAFNNAQGTTSMTGTFSVNTSNTFTYVNLANVGTGTAQVVVNATASLIGDTLNIMAIAGASTYSVVLSGNISSQTLAVSANKTGFFYGQFNGTEFIGTGTVQS